MPTFGHGPLCPRDIVLINSRGFLLFLQDALQATEWCVRKFRSVRVTLYRQGNESGLNVGDNANPARYYWRYEQRYLRIGTQYPPTAYLPCSSQGFSLVRRIYRTVESEIGHCWSGRSDIWQLHEPLRVFLVRQDLQRTVPVFQSTRSGCFSRWPPLSNRASEPSRA